MSNQNLLLEASQGSIHLYDNPDLTFAKIKQIFTSAANGELKGKEKTDGEKLYISFSGKDETLKCVNNKNEIKDGGMSIEKFVSSLDNNKKEIFKEALKSLEKAIHSLSQEEHIKLFGNDTNIFYLVEIIHPALEEVINYDTKTLIVHKNNILEFDKEQKKVINKAFSSDVDKLLEVVNDAQDELKKDKFGIQVGAIKKLKALSDKRALNTAISAIDNLISRTNNLINEEEATLNDDSTIAEYMTARVYILINSILKKGKIKDIDPIVKGIIAKRILGVKGISVNDVSAKISKQELQFVKENLLSDTSRKEILSTAISLLENIVNDFSVEMLKGLQSAFIVDNSKELQRLNKELQKAINNIQSSPNEESMKVLKKEINKLKKADKIETVVQGFSFDYDGKSYEFTGNFAPIRQILSLFKNMNKNTLSNDASKVEKNERAPIDEQKNAEKIIYDIINEATLKVKYSLLKNKIKEMSSMSGGAVVGSVGKRIVKNGAK